ncbi:putative thiamine diphosphokinase [Providencia alcalifaciens PAL-2]|nr:putative thiamine diphosphokinase [Providencia alcalifaciens F90-2004]EUC95692.1 putative thiamine diphosphokinase [Providencia alcalifaciens PAL-2]
MRLFGLENRVLSNRSSLFALLGECFPAILPSCWEVSSLAGLSGGSYLLESQPVSRTEKTFSTIKLIARAEGQAQSALFVNRRKEARILKQLKHFAYSPDVIGRNSDWLLLEWGAGDHPCHAQFLSSKFQYQLAEIVAKLHCQTLLSYRLPLRNEIAHYGYRIDKKRISSRWKRLHHHFLYAPMPNVIKLAPAHMDIHSGNVLCQQKVPTMLVDWEYAANTDIGLSLETYFQFNSLTLEQRDYFLTHYCQTFGAYKDKHHLARHCQQWEPWVKYMTLMWYEVQWCQRQHAQFLNDSAPLRDYFSL